MEWWVWLIIGIVGAILLFFLFPTYLVSNVIYTVLLVRKNKEKWSRTVSWDNEEQKQMFAIGEEWGKKYDEYRKTVSITSCGFKLIGEYFDFGNDKAVIIIPGRMESGTYSYYFSEPFRKGGYNVMAIDNRCHGLSEGRYNCLGMKEYKDILNWARFLHDELGIKEVVIHGICIGSATGLYAICSKDCPDYIKCIIADGMYINFAESFKNHLIEKKKPLFPFTWEVMSLIAMVSGHSPKKWGPLNFVKKLNKPILFIYSKEDQYSVPKYAQLLYDTCASKDKEIAWFPHGEHSHVRINQTEGYDEAIIKFLKEKC